MQQLLDIYPPNRIPATALMNASTEEDHHLNDLVKHMVEHQRKQGRDVSNQDMLDHIDDASRKMGLSPVEGRGLFSNLWKNIKKTASDVASSTWDKFKQNPIESLQSVYETAKPIVEKVVDKVGPLLSEAAPAAALAV